MNLEQTYTHTKAGSVSLCSNEIRIMIQKQIKLYENAKTPKQKLDMILRDVNLYIYNTPHGDTLIENTNTHEHLVA